MALSDSDTIVYRRACRVCETSFQLALELVFIAYYIISIGYIHAYLAGLFYYYHLYYSVEVKINLIYCFSFCHLPQYLKLYIFLLKFLIKCDANSSHDLLRILYHQEEVKIPRLIISKFQIYRWNFPGRFTSTTTFNFHSVPTRMSMNANITSKESQWWQNSMENTMEYHSLNERERVCEGNFLEAFFYWRVHSADTSKFHAIYNLALKVHRRIRSLYMYNPLHFITH